MVSARITLGQMGPVAFHGNGRRLARGESIISTNPSEIRYFQMQQGFAVVVLEGRMPDAPAVESEPLPLPAKAVKPAAVPAVKVTHNVQPEPDGADDLGGDDSEPLNKDALAAMTKGQLVIYGKERGIKVSIDSTKSALIQSILDATNESHDDPEE